MSSLPLTAAELEERLESSLDPTQSSPPLAAPLAQALALLARTEQEFVLHWTDIIAKTNTDMAYLFAAQAPEGLRRLRPADIEAWVVRAMDVYDKIGLYPACAVFRDVAAFAAEAHAATRGIAFEDVAGVLGPFVRGLSGRALKLENAEETYTDTASLFLPARLARFPDRDRNFRLYKATVGCLWAQVRYGSFRADLTAVLQRYPDPARARHLFQALETIRLDARLARDLAGLQREMAALRAALNESLWPPAWEGKIGRLRRPEATAEDSYALLAECYDGELPAPVCYQGTMQPERVAAATAARIAREKEEFRTALVQMLDDKTGAERQPAGKDVLAGRFSVHRDEAQPGEFSFTLHLDGRPVAPVTAGARPRRRSVPRTCGRGPITRKARFCTTSGTTGAPTTANTGARCANSTCTPNTSRSCRTRSASTPACCRRCARPSRRCAARTGCSRSRPTATTSTSTRWSRRPRITAAGAR